LGALQVGHDGHDLAHAGSGLAHQLGAVDVVLRLAVREIQAHHIDPGFQHRIEHLGGGRCRTQGGDDLGGTGHGQRISVVRVM